MVVANLKGGKMREDKKNTWKLVCIILVIIVIIQSTILIIKKLDKKEQSKTNTAQTEDKIERNSLAEDDIEENKRIRLDEDFSKEGKIEGIENVRWNNVRIMQNDDEMEVSIMLNNESQTEKIPGADLIVNLMDKAGKTVYTQEIKMQEISANYGYTSLDMTFKIKEPIIIYDVQILKK